MLKMESQLLLVVLRMEKEFYMVVKRISIVAYAGLIEITLWFHVRDFPAISIMNTVIGLRFVPLN